MAGWAPPGSAVERIAGLASRRLSVEEALEHLAGLPADDLLTPYYVMRRLLVGHDGALLAAKGRLGLLLSFALSKTAPPAVLVTLLLLLATVGGWHPPARHRGAARRARLDEAPSTGASSGDCTVEPQDGGDDEGEASMAIERFAIDAMACIPAGAPCALMHALDVIRACRKERSQRRQTQGGPGAPLAALAADDEGIARQTTAFLAGLDGVGEAGLVARCIILAALFRLLASSASASPLCVVSADTCSVLQSAACRSLIKGLTAQEAVHERPPQTLSLVALSPRPFVRILLMRLAVYLCLCHGADGAWEGCVAQMAACIRCEPWQASIALVALFGCHQGLLYKFLAAFVAMEANCSAGRLIRRYVSSTRLYGDLLYTICRWHGEDDGSDDARRLEDLFAVEARTNVRIPAYLYRFYRESAAGLLDGTAEMLAQPSGLGHAFHRERMARLLVCYGYHRVHCRLLDLLAAFSEPHSS